MHIKLAGQGDLDDLVRLNDQIQRQHAEQYPEVFRYPVDQDEVREFFEKLIASKTNTVIVAYDETQTFAYLYYELRQTPQNAFKFTRSRYYIHHVLVDESVRRSGTASALFDWVEKDARFNGITQIELDTWMLNKGAREFFERRGFRVTRLVYSKPS